MMRIEKLLQDKNYATSKCKDRRATYIPSYLLSRNYVVRWGEIKGGGTAAPGNGKTVEDENAKSRSMGNTHRHC